MRFVILLLVLRAAANDLYLMPQDFMLARSGRLVVAVHNGDSFPDSEDAPVLKRIAEAQAVSRTAAQPITGLREDGKQEIGTVSLGTSGEWVLGLRTTPNSVTVEPGKFEIYLRDKGLANALQWRIDHNQSKRAGREVYTEYAKSIVTIGKTDGFSDYPVGHAMEIIPLRDPGGTKAGDSLPIRVVLHGKAAFDLQVEAAFAPSNAAPEIRIVGRTDQNGEVTVKIEKPGTWRLHAVAMERSRSPAADWESFSASLTFQIR